MLEELKPQGPTGASHGTGCASHATAHRPASASHQLDAEVGFVELVHRVGAAAHPDLEVGRDAEEQDDGLGEDPSLNPKP